MSNGYKKDFVIFYTDNRSFFVVIIIDYKIEEVRKFTCFG